MLADFEQTMRLAAEESERRDHRYLGTEHALLGLMRTSNARAVGILRSRGLTVEAVEAELGRLDRSFGRAAVDEATCRVTRRPLWRRGRRDLAPLAKPVLVKRALELAERHAQTAGREQATIDDVLVGILRLTSASAPPPTASE